MTTLAVSPPPPAARHPRLLRCGGRRIVLVCGACERRGSGPKKLGAKEVAKQLERACRDAGVARPRIVLTSCLGACPKKAITVAAASPGGAMAMIAWHRREDAAAAVSALFAEAR